VFLGNIKEAFDKKPDLSNLLLDDFFKGEIQKCQVIIYNNNSFFLGGRGGGSGKDSNLHSFAYNPPF
jgi:hypothetical protein